MKRFVLRKGLTLEPAPGGDAHLTDTRTGDALLIPAEDRPALRLASTDGLAPGPESERYRPFLVEVEQLGEDAAPGFYELDLSDAPLSAEDELRRALAAPPPLNRKPVTGALPAADQPQPRSTPGRGQPTLPRSGPPPATFALDEAPQPRSTPGGRQPQAAPSTPSPASFELDAPAQTPRSTPPPALFELEPPAAPQPRSTPGGRQPHAGPSTPSPASFELDAPAQAPRSTPPPALFELDAPAAPRPRSTPGGRQPQAAMSAPSPASFELDAPAAPQPQDTPGGWAPPTAPFELDVAPGDLGAGAAPARVEPFGLELEPPRTPGVAPSFELEGPVALPSEAEEPALELTEEEQPPGEQPDAAGNFLSQEANLRQAMEVAPEGPQPNREAVAALVADEGARLAPAPAASAPAPARRGKAWGYAAVGVLLLAAGVAASLALRPGVETPPEPVLPTPPVTPPPAEVAVTPPPAEVVTPPPAEVVTPPPAEVVTPPPAEVVTPPPAEVVAAPEQDAGAPAAPDTWLEAKLLARGRVRMAEVVAGADGTVTWEVQEAQRVKGKQAVGALESSAGPKPLVADSVGLAMLKVPSGAQVKRGAVLADIIYFEAWGRGFVAQRTPTTAWRCEVSSAAAGQRADCKVSVVTPKPGGAQVMVAIEPRWFDEATDAVLRLAPP